MLTDSYLIHLIKKGHIEAFESLITRYKDRVYNIIYSFTSNAEESNDIAQIVFLKVYSNIKNFKGESAFSTWLYRITVNECYTNFKRKKFNMIELDAEIGNSEGRTLKDILADESMDTEKLLLSKEAQNEVRECINLLNNNYRMIIVLREIENFSYEDIAKIMKISQNKVKVWLFRARTKLKEELKKKGI